MKRAKKQAKENQHAIFKKDKRASDQLIVKGKKSDSKLIVLDQYRTNYQNYLSYGILAILKKWKTEESTM